MVEGGGAEQAPAAGAADGGRNNKQKGNDDSKRYRGRRNGTRTNKPWKDNNNPQSAIIQKEKFVGPSEDLKGFIHHVVFAKGGVAYTHTTEEIARYIGEKYTSMCSYIRTGILTLVVPAPTRPAAPVATGTPAVVGAVNQEIFKEKIWMYVKIESSIETTMKSLYDLIWGQCSESLRSRLRGYGDYNTYSVNADSIALLKGIRAKMTGFRAKQYLTHGLHKIMLDFYGLSQGKHQNYQEYYDEFNSMVLTAKESGATIGAHPGDIQEALKIDAIDANNPSDVERIAATKTATDRYLAVAFLLGADKLRYGTLVEEIENEYLRNKGNSSTAGTYPTTMAEQAYDYLCNYKKDPKNLTRLLGQNTGTNMNTGVAFAQEEAPQDDERHHTKEQYFATSGGANGGMNRKKICRRCGTDGHTSIECDSGQEKVAIYRQSQQPNQGVSQLIHAVDWDGATNTTDDEAQNWTFLSKAMFQSDGPIKCTEYNKNGSVAKINKSTIFSQANTGIPAIWYLLDNQST
jgi:hypothetical protein